MDIVRISGVIKDYAWGGRDYLPSLFSYTTTGAPQAEAWFGTHVAGEAKLDSGVTLKEYILKDPKKILGEDAFNKYGGEFPLLLKVLAILHPLSLQCHPNKQQAVEGWKREEKFRLSHDPGQWNYKDDNEKAEVIYALTPLTAMCGFRPYDAIVEHFKILFPLSYKKYFTDTHDIKSLFNALYSLKSEELEALIREYIYNLENNDEEFSKGQFLTEKGIALSCYKEYPKDPGLIAPYFLNVIHLRVGEAMFLAPRTLHAYVYGNGIELMNCSDNVLRGGLTQKKVDLQELIKIMNFESGSGEKAQLVKDKFGRTEVMTGTEDFALLSYPSGMYEIREQNAGIALITEGVARFSYGGEHIDIRKGDAVFIPHNVKEYTLNLRGKLFLAKIPI